MNPVYAGARRLPASVCRPGNVLSSIRLGAVGEERGQVQPKGGDAP